jgi:hypothetical protein
MNGWPMWTTLGILGTVWIVGGWAVATARHVRSVTVDRELAGYFFWWLLTTLWVIGPLYLVSDMLWRQHRDLAEAIRVIGTPAWLWLTFNDVVHRVRAHDAQSGRAARERAALEQAARPDFVTEPRDN